ncbi:hypothetical protein [Ideonella paludis]|uniref:Alpha/beta hydrolase n=1 Tax=Ideonella paludis TaxID=1233411 RepID=A0ABS5E0Q9_9BURK|nr:hypothetical protein [Ideonella paludis]MBQ0936651.1 hypothetical protein [Ideonella paludis]
MAHVTVSATLGLLGNGSWLSMCRLSWVAGLTLALPSLVGLVGIFSAVTALSLLWAMSAAATPSAPIQVSYGLGAALALGAALMLPRGWRYGQGGWLMRSTASLLRYARGQAPEIDGRISLWSEVIANRMASGDDDEVQVVAHSSGCIAAVAALSRAIDRLERTQKTRKAVSLLTLGQCIPVLSHQPEAKSFRVALKHLGQSKSLTWIDVSAPPDACCFALTDPCASPHDSDAHSENVKRLSPRYAEQMDSGRYQALKADKLRCHFQYLMAFPKPKHYDFFQWVCGPQTLQQTTQHLKSINNFKRFSW